MRVVAVVLAGGRSKRFGSDKLSAVVGGMSLLDRAISGLSDQWPLVVVGPERKLSRTAAFVREDPPGSGPAAALVAGARAAVARGAQCMVTLPGDAPQGGRAAAELVASLLDGDAEACVAVDSAGVEQPLQLAVRGTALASLAALDQLSVAGASARSLLLSLDATPVPMPARWTTDIDTPEQAALWSKI